MRNLRTAIARALGLLIGAASVAFAAGLWPGFPVVGATTYATFTTLENIPADTNVTAGAGPGTVLVNVGQLGNGAVFDSTAAASATIPNNAPKFVLDTGTGTTYWWMTCRPRIGRSSLTRRARTPTKPRHRWSMMFRPRVGPPITC
ncbi:MAG: hypothetical protein JO208_01630, partial [Alphaproteobacteria bacterium]|nr:hypothetical protein [Alphaproteobacteria bacterium]